MLGIGEEQRDRGKGELNHKYQCSVCWSSSGTRAEPSGAVHWLLINSTWKNRGEEGELSLEMELFFLSFILCPSLCAAVNIDLWAGATRALPVPVVISSEVSRKGQYFNDISPRPETTLVFENRP